MVSRQGVQEALVRAFLRAPLLLLFREKPFVEAAPPSGPLPRACRRLLLFRPDFHRCACFVNVCACQELSAGGFGALTGGENRACEPASAESKEAGRVRPQRRPRRKGTACG